MTGHGIASETADRIDCECGRVFISHAADLDDDEFPLRVATSVPDPWRAYRGHVAYYGRREGGAACVVCLLPALPESYVVRYEGGEVPPIAGAKFHLCEPHRDALALAPRRPVVSYADEAREALGLAQRPQDRR